MKVRMYPGIEYGGTASGIGTVVKKYHEHLPKHGIQFVDHEEYDVLAVHAGAKELKPEDKTANIVSFCHGVYWTGDYEASNWEQKANKNVINTIRHSKLVTVPSRWVAELFQRDMRFTPDVLPHGVDWDEWQPGVKDNGYVLAYAKNRVGDVCDNVFLRDLAPAFPETLMVSTFPVKGRDIANLQVTGVLPHKDMAKLIKESSLVISPVKETFGILTLEAMAAGKPVLGFDYGGNRDIIRHGITGYLARPGDYEDLKAGLAYCMQHRKTLGDNARIVAKEYTWEIVCQQVYDIFERAAQGEYAETTIVIPVYNKPLESVARAINSVKAQTRRVAEIIVVDDGSKNGKDLEKMVKEMGATYFRQANAGVAVARNTGVYAAKTKYVGCLDADDAYAPGFVEACVQALEADNELHLAYTRLMQVFPDGTQRVSPWPAEWNYDKQLTKPNQVPTANIFRKETFERLGGYKSRYCPQGAGSEDAELWTRWGAFGYKCALVTNEPLFLYTIGQGQTSKEGYVEIDWRAMKPWVNDQIHPFASYASPGNGFSHKVFQYDEPEISIVIPVGENHIDNLPDALDSIEAQTFRRWEAIAVLDFDASKYQEKILRIKKAYPYVRYIHNRSDTILGAGWARNQGADIARSKMLLFLDADDHLKGTALEEMLIKWNATRDIVYSDYICISKTDNPQQLIQDINEDPFRKMLSFDGANEVVYEQAASEYFDCERAIAQPPPAGEAPYLWALVSCLIPKIYHEKIGGFDERMRSFEDLDYHWRLARAGYCYSRIDKPLIVYRFYSGTRRVTGLQNHVELLEYLRDKFTRIGVDDMACGCKNKKNPTMRIKSDGTVSIIESKQATGGTVYQVFTTKDGRKIEASDNDLLLVQYNDARMGAHQVFGGQTGINYGRRKGGDRFLVHTSDVYMLVRGRQQLLNQFIPLEVNKVAAPEEPAPTPPPPPEQVSTPKPEPVAETVRTMPAPVNLAEAFDFSTLEGIGAKTNEKLHEMGIKTLFELIAFGEASLKEMRGISSETARNIVAQAVRITSGVE